MTENRKQLPQLHCLDIPITRTCNKKCGGCYYISPYTKGHDAPAKIAEWCKSASVTLKSNGFSDTPKQIEIVGGEPFSHPQFPEIIESVRQIWNTETLVFTNGLDGRKPLEYTDILRQYNCKVMVSAHSEAEVQWAEKLQGDFIERGVWAEVQNSFSKWKIMYDVEHSKDFVTIRSRTDPTLKKAQCRKQDGHCPSLYNGKIYPCSIWASFAALVAGDGKTNVRWDTNIEIAGRMLPPLPQHFKGRYAVCWFCGE